MTGRFLLSCNIPHCGQIVLMPQLQKRMVFLLGNCASSLQLAECSEGETYLPTSTGSYIQKRNIWDQEKEPVLSPQHSVPREQIVAHLDT